MENITPPLFLLWEVRRSLEKGNSVGEGIKTYLKLNYINEYSKEVESWWASKNNNLIQFEKSQLGHYRRYLLEILEEGLRGSAILPALQDLEDELILSCESEIQEHLVRLPVLALIPLMLLIFPSIMMLFLAPLLELLKL